MNNILRLLAANMAAIIFLIFAGWCLNTDHHFFAFISFTVAITSAKTLESQ